MPNSLTPSNNHFLNTQFLSFLCLCLITQARTHLAYHILSYHSVINNRTTSVSQYNTQMYPKVKIRTELQDDQHAVHEHDWSSLLSLKDIQFLSIQDSCFPVRGHQDVSPSPIARIPKSYVPNVGMPKVSTSEEVDKKSSFDEENKPNIRASSIPRPRAVLSSPDNDAVIGNKNRIKTIQPSPLKNHKLIQNRHARAQCKVIPSQAIGESPTSTEKSKDMIDDKSEPKEKKGLATAISSQRRNIATDKPSSMRI